MHQQYRTFVEQFHGTNANINNMIFWTGKVFMVEVALLVLLSSSATAQWDPATGHVKPSATSGPPFFDPAPWNGGYKVTFRSVPISRSTAGIPEWPYAPVRGVDTTQECSTYGFDTTPASTVDMVSVVVLAMHASRNNLSVTWWRPGPNMRYQSCLQEGTIS